ncbi:MAG: hypothetical protein EOO38_04875 [Cytophagaceae bacterium]|nr:MAG: hypothetical protein EOO38_04875 [Cytophagaceae bacterium]
MDRPKMWDIIPGLLEQGVPLAMIRPGLYERKVVDGSQVIYPNLAAWPGGTGLAPQQGSEDNVWDFSASLSSGLLPGFHNISYEVLEARFHYDSASEIYRAADNLIQEWREANSALVEYCLNAWNRGGDWGEKYPHIQGWAGFGKRYCISIGFNVLTTECKASVWHYNKAINQETVIFRLTMRDIQEPEFLRLVDEGIESWRQHNEHLWGALPV